MEVKKVSIIFHGPRVTESYKIKILYQLEDWEYMSHLHRTNVCRLDMLCFRKLRDPCWSPFARVLRVECPLSAPTFFTNFKAFRTTPQGDVPVPVERKTLV